MGHARLYEVAPNALEIPMTDPDAYEWGDWVSCPRCDSTNVQLLFDIFGAAQISIECRNCNLASYTQSPDFHQLFSS